MSLAPREIAELVEGRPSTASSSRSQLKNLYSPTAVGSTSCSLPLPFVNSESHIGDLDSSTDIRVADSITYSETLSIPSFIQTYTT